MDPYKPVKGARPANLRAVSAVLRKRAETSESPYHKELLLRRADELDKSAAELDSSRAPTKQFAVAAGLDLSEADKVELARQSQGKI